MTAISSSSSKSLSLHSKGTAQHIKTTKEVKKEIAKKGQEEPGKKPASATAISSSYSKRASPFSKWRAQHIYYKSNYEEGSGKIRKESI
jgi:hypothetical protein